MPFVLDASVAAAWLMPDERDPVSEAAYKQIAQDEAVVPSLWWFELRNMLIINERRGRLDEPQTARILLLLRGLPVAIDTGVEEDALLWLARQHKLTVYDAAYLELARRRRVRLATLDSALVRAARAEGVALIR